MLSRLSSTRKDQHFNTISVTQSRQRAVLFADDFIVQHCGDTITVRPELPQQGNESSVSLMIVHLSVYSQAHDITSCSGTSCRIL